MILAKHNTARLIPSVICQPSRVTTIVLETLLAAPHLSNGGPGVLCCAGNPSPVIPAVDQ